MMETTWTRIFQNGILLISVLVLFFLIDVHVGLIMTASALVALLLLMALRSRGIPLWLTLRQMSTTFFGFLSEQLVATEDIRANGAKGDAEIVVGEREADGSDRCKPS